MMNKASLENRVQTFLKLGLADLMSLTQTKYSMTLTFLANDEFDKAADSWADLQAISLIIGTHISTAKAAREN
jgi:hypothetical protein